MRFGNHKTKRVCSERCESFRSDGIVFGRRRGKRARKKSNLVLRERDKIVDEVIGDVLVDDNGKRKFPFANAWRETSAPFSEHERE